MQVASITAMPVNFTGGRPFSVTFETDSAELDRPSKEQLIWLVGKIIDKEGSTVVVTGHTDITGPLTHNQRLALERAKSVGEFLISMGLPSARIKLDGRGPYEPMGDNKTEDGRAINRRVELFVMDN